VLPPGVVVPNGPMQNPAVQMPPGQAPLTSPRPGFLPAPPAGQPNPYGQPNGPGAQPTAPGAQPTTPGFQSPLPGGVPPPFVRPPGGPGGPGGDQ
jgi:hypothetical protein